MVNPAYDDETLVETLKVVGESNSRAEAAARLGIRPRTLRDRLAAAEARNLTGGALGGVFPEGYSASRLVRLVSPQGQILEWQRLDADRGREAPEWLDEALSRIAETEPVGLVLAPSVYTDAHHRLNMIPIPDVHLGMHAWGAETGESYSLDLATRGLQTAVSRLMTKLPSAETALIVNLGDYYHANNNQGETARHRHRMDVDNRYKKVVDTGVDLMIWIIDAALATHSQVVVKLIPGNHDEETMVALEAGVKQRYAFNPRVTVLTSPDPYFFYRHGYTMLMFHHGHLTAPKDAPSVMAALAPHMWGETIHRYAFMGHFHRSKGSLDFDEVNGAKWEVLRAITAKDAWNHAHAFTSKRTLIGVTYDLRDGEVERHSVPVANPEEPSK